MNDGYHKTALLHEFSDPSINADGILSFTAKANDTYFYVVSCSNDAGIELTGIDWKICMFCNHSTPGGFYAFFTNLILWAGVGWGAIMNQNQLLKINK